MAAAAPALALLLAGCALLVPSARIEAPVARPLAPAAAMACARAVIAELARTRSLWATDVTLFDAAGGRLETGHFPDPNVVGLRVALHYDAGHARFEGRLKASGLYFVDLGANAAARQIEALLARCP